MIKIRYKRLLAILCLLLLLVACGLYGFMRMPPTWYHPPDPSEEKVAELADLVEYRLLEEFQKIRPEPEPWKLRIREDQINAWLATKLRGWVAHNEDLTWPDDLDMPQIRFEPEGISLALAMEALGPSKIVVMRIKPQFVDGNLLANVNRFSVGRLNLPGAPMERVVAMIDRYLESDAGDDPAAQLLMRMFRGEEQIDPVLELADRRRVRLMNIELDEGSLVMTARTLPAKQQE